MTLVIAVSCYSVSDLNNNRVYYMSTSKSHCVIHVARVQYISILACRYVIFSSNLF